MKNTDRKHINHANESFFSIDIMIDEIISVFHGSIFGIVQLLWLSNYCPSTMQQFSSY